MCNAYCFSTATTVAIKNVTLCVRCLHCPLIERFMKHTVQYTKMKPSKHGITKTDKLYCNELNSILLLLDNCHNLLTTKRETSRELF